MQVIEPELRIALPVEDVSRLAEQERVKVAMRRRGAV
jgi:hypothetical protein